MRTAQERSRVARLLQDVGEHDEIELLPEPGRSFRLPDDDPAALAQTLRRNGSGGGGSLDTGDGHALFRGFEQELAAAAIDLQQLPGRHAAEIRGDLAEIIPGGRRFERVDMILRVAPAGRGDGARQALELRIARLRRQTHQPARPAFLDAEIVEGKIVMDLYAAANNTRSHGQGCDPPVSPAQTVVLRR